MNNAIVVEEEVGLMLERKLGVFALKCLSDMQIKHSNEDVQWSFTKSAALVSEVETERRAKVSHRHIEKVKRTVCRWERRACTSGSWGLAE